MGVEPGLFISARIRVSKSTLTLKLNADENWKCNVLDLNCRFTNKQTNQKATEKTNMLRNT